MLPAAVLFAFRLHCHYAADAAITPADCVMPHYVDAAILLPYFADAAADMPLLMLSTTRFRLRRRDMPFSFDF